LPSTSTLLLRTQGALDVDDVGLEVTEETLLKHTQESNGRKVGGQLCYPRLFIRWLRRT